MQVVGQHVLGLPGMMATGARVSNAYPTCPLPRDSLAKVRLIPHAFHVSHGIWKKGIYTGKGWGCVPLAGMGRGSERKVPHIGTETRSKLLREAAVRNIGQWAEA